MIGAIIGDIVGSVYEFNNVLIKDFDLFTSESIYTDDTICTIAFADCLMNNGDPVEYLQRYCRKYDSPMGGYGGMFKEWTRLKEPKPYYSWGNGGAMRISAIPNLLTDWEDIEKTTIRYTAITHNAPYGIAGALAVSRAIFLAKNATDKKFLIDVILEYFPAFDVYLTVDQIRETNHFNESAQGTVPHAIKCVMESSSFDDAIRNAVSIGGDSDTIACIAGGIAESYYKKIDADTLSALALLPYEFLLVINEYNYLKNPSEHLKHVLTIPTSIVFG